MLKYLPTPHSSLNLASSISATSATYLTAAIFIYN